MTTKKNSVFPADLQEAWDEVLFQAKRLCYISKSNPMYDITVQRLQQARARRDEIRSQYKQSRQSNQTKEES